MYRTFLSLYFVIVAAIVAVGWGLDKLWQYYGQEPVVSQVELDLLYLLEHALTESDSDRSRELLKLNAQLQGQVNILSIDDFAASKVSESIREGEVAVVNTRSGEKILYKQIVGGESVVAVALPGHMPGRSLFYDLFLIVFYASIALVVFFWVWPLSRDLRKLERQTKTLGKNTVDTRLAVSPASPVYDLAAAFSRMSRRIDSLLASHKEMTYAVSHELRTPLARMKFGLEMAAECDDLVRVKKQLAGVRLDVTEMDGLVNELLAYAAFEQNDQPLNLQPGDLQSLIEQLIERARGNPLTQRIEITFVCHAASTQVVCEWYLMERALVNLLQNAVRFAAGRVQVSLDRQGEQFVVCVDDDGPGIPAEERERVFNSFVRLNSEVNAHNRGFGLGLAIVKRIVEWHAGTVSAAVSPLGGARIRLAWLRREPASPGYPASPP